MNDNQIKSLLQQSRSYAVLATSLRSDYYLNLSSNCLKMANKALRQRKIYMVECEVTTTFMIKLAA